MGCGKGAVGGVRGCGVVFGTWCREEELNLCFSGARCFVTNWVRTLGWVQVSGLWVLTYTGIKISLEKAVVANLFLTGVLLTPSLLKDVSLVNRQ